MSCEVESVEMSSVVCSVKMDEQDKPPDERHPLINGNAQDQDTAKKDVWSNDVRDTSVCVIVDLANDDRISCTAFKDSTWRWIRYVLLCILSVGILPVLCYWKPHWKLKLTAHTCSLASATKVLLKTDTGSLEVQRVISCSLANSGQASNLISHEMNHNCAGLRYFINRHLRYYFNEEINCFEHVAGLGNGKSLSQLHEMKTGLSKKERDVERQFFGDNLIDVPEKSYSRLLFEESANPFYVFQVLSCILWCFDSYYYYAAAIIVTTIVSIVISTYQSMVQLKKLRKMIACSDFVEIITNNGQRHKVCSDSLVPGDVVIISSSEGSGLLHCDAVLLDGTVIVDESMLTGESTPITKAPLPLICKDKDSGSADVFYNEKQHKRHTLFCGTKVLQTRGYGSSGAIVVVTKTGFSTMKGDLIRSILFPKPVDFKFYKDALKFVLVLAFFAVCGFAYTVYVKKKEGAAVKEIFIRGLDIFTIAIPPALPAAMAVGTVYALRRLRKKDIFCICPSRINMSGKLKLFCFDKTGTLTEDSLDFFGLLPSKHHTFEELCHNCRSLDPESDVTVCMASCHSLTMLNDGFIGDPLDLKMFAATHWTLDEEDIKEADTGGCKHRRIVSAPLSSYPIQDSKERQCMKNEILKQFTFSSEVQKMSVITRRIGSEDLMLYCKGAPEAIAKCCMQASLPDDFEDVLAKYAKMGYRVLALASKKITSDIQLQDLRRLQRHSVECDLTFHGLLLMKNLLKPETTPVINKLQIANIRVVMVTGDNILTAMCVARECLMIMPEEKIIHVTADVDSESSSIRLQYQLVGEADEVSDELDIEDSSSSNGILVRQHKRRLFGVNHYPKACHFAMTGMTYRLIRRHSRDLLKRFLVSGTVFARMLPSQKTDLIEDLQALGYSVGMCGDGANDCGALKIAQTGISLSEAEASVASPFTSKVPNIECVPKVIKEGRCSLVTAYSIFKFMALYSMIQFTSVLLLYYHSSNIGDFQFLFIDLFVITPFAVTLSYSGPYPVLYPRRPLGSLIHPLVITSLVFQILLQFCIQFAIFLYAPTMPFYRSVDWFKKHDYDIHSGTTQIKSTINTSIFLVSCFQYIILAIVFSISKPYRESLIKNKWFLACILFLTGFVLILVFAPIPALRKFFHLTDISDYLYLGTIVMAVAGHALIAYLIERQLVLMASFRKFLNWIRCKKDFKNPYKYVLREISKDPNWPPVVDLNKQNTKCPPEKNIS